jgi:hypothetical protein
MLVCMMTRGWGQGGLTEGAFVPQVMPKSTDARLDADPEKPDNVPSRLLPGSPAVQAANVALLQFVMGMGSSPPYLRMQSSLGQPASRARLLSKAWRKMWGSGCALRSLVQVPWWGAVWWVVIPRLWYCDHAKSKTRSLATSW